MLRRQKRVLSQSLTSSCDSGAEHRPLAMPVSEVPKPGQEHKWGQKSIKERNLLRKRKSAKEPQEWRKKSAKRALLRQNCKQPDLKQPYCGMSSFMCFWKWGWLSLCDCLGLGTLPNWTAVPPLPCQCMLNHWLATWIACGAPCYETTTLGNSQQSPAFSEIGCFQPSSHFVCLVRPFRRRAPNSTWEVRTRQ